MISTIVLQLAVYQAFAAFTLMTSTIVLQPAICQAFVPTNHQPQMHSFSLPSFLPSFLPSIFLSFQPSIQPVLMIPLDVKERFHFFEVFIKLNSAHRKQASMGQKCGQCFLWYWCLETGFVGQSTDWELLSHNSYIRVGTPTTT